MGVAALSRAEHPAAYDEGDVRLACDLAARAAVHIDNARLYTREHDAAVTLQRSLLPRGIPPVAGLEVAYRYQPASRAAEIGGDWFDVIPLEAGQVALVVGDVTGHGIHAAAIMGQLRTTTAALARLGCPPPRSCASSTTWSPPTATRPAPPACTRSTTRPRGGAAWPARGTPRPRCAAPAAHEGRAVVSPAEAGAHYLPGCHAFCVAAVMTLVRIAWFFCAQRGSEPDSRHSVTEAAADRMAPVAPACRPALSCNPFCEPGPSTVRRPMLSRKSARRMRL